MHIVFYMHNPLTTRLNIIARAVHACQQTYHIKQIKGKPSNTAWFPAAKPVFPNNSLFSNTFMLYSDCSRPSQCLESGKSLLRRVGA